MAKYLRDKPPSRAKWEKALGKAVITTADAAALYQTKFGNPLSRALINRWIQKGYVKVVGRAPKYPHIVRQASIAYCAEVHAWRLAVGIAKTVPLLDRYGQPSQPALKDPATRTKEHRQRLARGIRLRPKRRRSRALKSKKP